MTFSNPRPLQTCRPDLLRLAAKGERPRLAISRLTHSNNSASGHADFAPATMGLLPARQGPRPLAGDSRPGRDGLP